MLLEDHLFSMQNYIESKAITLGVNNFLFD